MYQLVPIFNLLCGCVMLCAIKCINAEQYGAILRFLQTQDLKDTLGEPVLSEDTNQTPSWVNQEDYLAEYESSQSERMDDLRLKAIQKRRAANTLRSYAEAMQVQLEKAKKTNGKKLDKFKLTTQLEANLARAALLYKQADLLDEKALETKKNLDDIQLSTDRESVLIKDCNILKVGPLFYHTRMDGVSQDHKDPLMAKLTGNTLVLYRKKSPILTFYLVDVELPTKPVENAPSCLSFGYRGAEQTVCAGAESSAHTWMNALAEAWYCNHMDIKGTLVNHHIKESEDHSILKYAKNNDKSSKGLVNMEVFVDDSNKTHLLVNGKEKPISGTTNVLNIAEILKDKQTIER